MQMPPSMPGYPISAPSAGFAAYDAGDGGVDRIRRQG